LRPFSGRLDFSASENRLTRAEARRRQAGLTLLDLTPTNPTSVGIPYPAEALAQALARPEVAGYHPSPFGLEEARAAVAADYARRGVTIAPEAIALTASSSESYALLFKLLADPGAAVLVPRPSYPLFDYLARLEGVEPRPYPLVYDGRWRIDHRAIDRTGARALCLVSPNNPTGSFTHGDDLRALGGELPIIADEVFADYCFAPGPGAATSVAGGEALTFSLGGLSKGSGLPQMKVGWIATSGPPALVREALSRLELLCDTYLSVGTPVQLALPALLALGERIRGAIRARVEENRAVLGRAVAGSAATWLPAEGGWSAVLRVPAVRSDEDWAIRLVEEAGVLVQPGYFFDLEVGVNLVLSLITPPDVFRTGLDELVARLDD
jgi:alanine-synthesizing transaminase